MWFEPSPVAMDVATEDDDLADEHQASQALATLETSVLEAEEDQTEDELDSLPAIADGNVVPPLRHVWQTLPSRVQEDIYGYHRNPAFWFTLNFPYNYVYEVHRFADAVQQASTMTHETFLAPAAAAPPPSPDAAAMPPALPTEEQHLLSGHAQHPVLDSVSRDAHAGREQWSKDNPGIVVFMHALKVELLVKNVMQLVVPSSDLEPFQYWLRFEFGTNTGNPHAHGTVSYTHLTLPTICSV